jgi:hypothetical protein
LRSIPMSDLVAQFRKPKKWNRMKGCTMCQGLLHVPEYTCI